MFKKILNPELNSNLFFWFVCLLPIFYLPLKFSGISFSKIGFVFISVLLMTIIFVVNYFKTTKKNIVFNFLHLNLIFILISYTLSTIFSKNFAVSLFGRDLALDSWMTIFLLLSFVFVISNSLKKEKIANIFLGIVISSGIVSLIQVLHLLVPAFPSLGIFYGVESNLLGKVNDLGFFLVLAVAIIVLVLEQIQVTKRFKVVLYSILVLDLALILLINFKASLYLLAGFSICFTAYKVFFFEKLMNKISEKEFKLFGVSLVVAVVSVLWIFLGSGISNAVSNRLNFSYLEVRPNIESTFEVSKKTLKENLFFGSGPSTFEVQWPLFKSKEILSTEFWNLDFRYGFGFLPTFVATTGVVGSLVWLTFILTIIFFSIKALLFKTKDINTKFILNTSAVSVLILWTVFTFYLPSTVLLVLTFAMTGVFIFLLQELKIIESRKIESEKILKLLMICLIVLVSLVTIKTLIKFYAQVNFQKASKFIYSNNDLGNAKLYIEKSIKLDPIDTYYRSLAEINALGFYQKINSAEKIEDLNAEELKNTISELVSNYNLAIKYDPYNYNNYLNLADVYTEFVNLSIFPDESYKTAQTLYEKTLELKGNNPLISLKKAKLAFLKKDYETSKKLIIEAIYLKPNYLEAYVSLAQLNLSMNDGPSAIQAIKEYLKIFPNDVNAKTQLVFVYVQLGMNKEAIEDLVALEKIYPNDAELKKLLADLKSGKNISDKKENLIIDEVVEEKETESEEL